MHDAHRAKLESFGLSTGEAQIYLTLLRSGGTLGASALAKATRIPRTGVYPLLNALIQKGIVEAEAGYGSRFTAIAPTHALPSLIAREREEQLEKLSQRERLAADLMGELESIIEPAVNSAEAEVIQVLRDPRVVAQWFERLQLETERQIDGFVKAPFFVRPGNPTHSRAFRKGVRYRGLYERAVLDAPGVKPYLSNWLGEGEEARIYDGELPHKLAIFDSKIVLMPLIRPREQTKTVLIRHPQLAQTLTLAFEHLWGQAEPIVSPKRKKIFKPVPVKSHAKSPAQTKESAAIKNEGNAAGLVAGRNGQRPFRRAKG
jgi:sugar-specific transcriptional regulator TrmB